MQCLKRCGLFLAGLAMLLALTLGGTVWFATDWLVDVDPPEKSDAIILLSGQPTRSIQVGDLYRQGIAPKVYVSSEVPRWEIAYLAKAGVEYQSNEEVMLKVLAVRGVPDSAIVLFGKRDLVSTRAEGEALRATLPADTRRLTVVTSPYHTRRARLILSRALPGREIRMVANSHEPWTKDWWNNKTVAYSIVLEFASTLFYYAGGKF